MGLACRREGGTVEARGSEQLRLLIHYIVKEKLKLEKGGI